MHGKTEKLIIVGAGETADIAYEYFSFDSPYEVVAFSVEQEYMEEDLHEGLPVIAFDDLLNHFDPATHKMYVGISYVELNRVRTRLFRAAKKKGYKLASYVSSHAFVWHNVEIGENTFIFEKNVIQHRAKIGDNVILWSGNHVGHRTVIHDNCYISSHVVLSGFCEVGENSFLGVNSCVGNNLTIANDCVIGAGAVITKDTEERRVYVGNPAKPLEKRDSFRTFNVRE